MGTLKTECLTIRETEVAIVEQNSLGILFVGAI